MRTVSIPIVEYLETCSTAAFEQGFSYLIILLAREADAEKTYEQIQNAWDSLHDITGNNFLFLFAGPREDRAPWDSPLQHEKYKYPGLVNPLISIPGAGQFLIPNAVYTRQNHVASTHTQSISELRDYFQLSEADVPSLLFLPTFPNAQDKKLVIPLQSFSSLYGFLKHIRENSEKKLVQLQGLSQGYMALCSQIDDYDMIITGKEIKKHEQRMIETISFINSYIAASPHDASIIHSILAQEELIRRDNFNAEVRINLHRYLNLTAQYPGLEDVAEQLMRRQSEARIERERVCESLKAVENQILNIYCEIERNIRTLEQENSLPQNKPTTKRRFKIALTFPGGIRDFVEPIANKLAQKYGKKHILYDLFHRAEFSRPNLDTYLQTLYNTESDLIVAFFCKEYQQKKWCCLEWRAIRDLISQRNNDDRVMLVKCEDVEIEGLFTTTDGFFDIRQMSAKDIEDLVAGIFERYDMLS